MARLSGMPLSVTSLQRLTGLQRRGLTVLVGAATVAVLGSGVMVAPVPYVLLQPGPTVDTLGEDQGVPVIQIEGLERPEGEQPDGEPETTTGQLRLTTVSVQPDVNLVAAIRAWFSNEQAVVPEEMFYPPGQSREQVEQRNTEQFTRSQSAAEFAAMRQLGYPVRIEVAEVVEGGPADGVLRADDVITAVDGTAIEEPEDLTAAVTAHPVGTEVTVEYLRDGEAGSATLATVPDEEDPQTPRIGVLAATVVDHPYELEIQLDEIGGPSAGLMFALGIIDKVEPEDLTGGKIIAGTGTIDTEGTVSPIGGVPQKLAAARQAGATVFLTPAENCPEAVANAQPGLLLVEVETLADALDGLAALRAGESPDTCD